MTCFSEAGLFRWNKIILVKTALFLLKFQRVKILYDICTNFRT